MFIWKVYRDHLTIQASINYQIKNLVLKAWI